MLFLQMALIVVVLRLGIWLVDAKRAPLWAIVCLSVWWLIKSTVYVIYRIGVGLGRVLAMPFTSDRCEGAGRVQCPYIAPSGSPPPVRGRDNEEKDRAETG